MGTSYFSKSISLVGLTILAFVACSEIDTTQTMRPGNVEQTKSDGKISLEQALATLQETLDVIDDAHTRSHPRTIKSIDALGYSDLTATTRSDSGEIGDLVYLVNFDNDEGYAVLAADESLAPVIVVTDTGTLSSVDLYNVSSIVPLSEEDYKSSEYYDEENDDYYLGEEDEESEEYRSFPLSLIKTYILNYKSLPTPGTPPLVPPQTTTTTIKYGPYIKTKWDQETPFNDMVSKSWPIGCTVIAAVQLFAYEKKPAIEKYKVDASCTWERLENCKIGEKNMDDVEKASIAKICKTIADKIDIRYNFLGSGGSYSTPNRVKNYMNTLGYNATRVFGYDLSEIRNMLKDGKPVFIGSFSMFFQGLLLRATGHAWLIDGQREIIECTYTDDVKLSVITVKESLLHCNWGWAGAHDGYYESKVFETVNASARKDYEEGLDEASNSDNPKGVHFGKGAIYRFITY